MICPNCRQEIDDNSRFCKYCGTAFAAAPQPQPYGEPQPYTEPQPQPYAEPQPQPYAEPQPQSYAEPQAQSYAEPQAQSFAVDASAAPAADDEAAGFARYDEERLNQKNKTRAVQLAVALVVLLVLGAVIAVIVVSGAKSRRERVTDAVGEEIRQGIGKTEMYVTERDGETRQIVTDKSLVAAEDILAKYTELMNRMKDDAPGCKRIRYQNLPSEQQDLGGLNGVGKLVLPIIDKYVTSKDAAEPELIAAGNSAELPLRNSSFGCLLTDSAKIKNAYCEVLGNNQYKLVITLQDEEDPPVLPAGAESVDSAVTAMFDPYDAGQSISAVAGLALSDIGFTYRNCTATLVYETGTDRIVSLRQVMDIDVSAKLIVADAKARIVDTLEWTDFRYD